MENAAPANDLERRKQLRVRLRRDLAIEAQKYEGRTFYVVKDPVSLRYYRLKDNEHFLLQFLDGKHTLEDAQKDYEVRYRPDRLKLEDVESFAQQLLNAGLAQNESPRAGKQLYEQRSKRQRSEWMQTLTNILYIKIPIFDPDRLLKRMLRWVGWIFSLWFFALSVGLMLSAALLVATHFETFRTKLPDQHLFFSFKTVVYLWAALGVVKVIHEFGHGLSCKVFGGEVHEMGALLLCLSPALYCNVSDAWTLPSKWHRIIISSAGIYVELVIAAIATFVWWNSRHPAVHQQPGAEPDGRVQRQHGGLQRQPADALRRLLRAGRLAGDPQPARAVQPLPQEPDAGASAWASRCRRSRTWLCGGACCSCRTRSSATSTAGW